jgi:hypothetical protein
MKVPHLITGISYDPDERVADRDPLIGQRARTMSVAYHLEVTAGPWLVVRESDAADLIAQAIEESVPVWDHGVYRISDVINKAPRAIKAALEGCTDGAKQTEHSRRRR